MAVSLSLSITQNSQSVANNTSNISVAVKASWTGGSWNGYQKDGSVTIDGTKYTFTSSFNTGKSTTGSQTLYTKTVDVGHNSDGTKTVSCSASYVTGVSSGTISASGSKTLTTIPRKSTMSVGNGTLGTAQTLSVTKQSSGFTHTITYKCGSATGTICTKSSSTSVSFTPPLSLANQNTTGTSLSITYTLTTYNGSTDLGSNTYTKSLSIPSSVKPSCSISVSDPTGYKDTYGGYVQGKSKFAVSVSASTSYGSAISSYSTTANGSTYTSSSFTTDVIKSSGTLSINSSVTDKRGRSGSDSESVTVLGYSLPVLNATASRCNQDGTANDQGAYIKIVYSCSITNLNSKNKLSTKIKYKKSSESSYTEVTDIWQSSTTSYTDRSYIIPAETESTYNIIVYGIDNLGEKTKILNVSSIFAFMHFKGERSMGLGKLAEYSDGLDVGFPTRFNEPVCGLVMGLGQLPRIPANSDLNDYIRPGSYAIYTNADAATIANMPSREGYYYYAGRLEVCISTGEKGDVNDWYSIRQKFIPYGLTECTYERQIIHTTSDTLEVYPWIATSNAFRYSNYETCIGLWVDNKPLYRKVVHLTSGFSSGLTNIPHNISNVETIWIESAFMNAYGTSQMLPLYLYNSATATDPVSLKVGTGNVVIMTNSGWGNWQMHVVLHYTKTTDEEV